MESTLGEKMKLLKKIVPLLMVVLVLSPVQAQAKTSVLAGPLTELDPNAATVRIALTGFPAANGLYIQQCNAPVDGARPTDCGPAQLWISTSPGASFAPTDSIIFKPTSTYTTKNGLIDCKVTSCGIWFSYDRTALADKAEDQFIPITFKASSTAVALPSDEITATLNGVELSPRKASDLGYRAIGKISATAKSGSELTFASSTPDCTISNMVVTALKGSGFCNISVTSAGSATFATYTANYPLKLVPGMQFVGVKKFPLSMTKGLARGLVSETNFGTPISYKATKPNICAIEGNLLLAKKKGVCVLRATAPARADMWGALTQTIQIQIKDKVK